MNYQEIEGDLIKLAKEGLFDVIAHGCNCFCKMKRGIAPQMHEAFNCNNFKLEDNMYEGDINKLGQIDYRLIYDNIVEPTKRLWVINCYTQYDWDTKTRPLDYEALTLCLRKINKLFAGKHIGLPLIGCHLAGGVWDKNLLDENSDFDFNNTCFKDVKTIIKQELKDMNVTIVHYKP